MTVKLFEGCYGKMRDGTIAGPFLKNENIKKFQFPFYFDDKIYQENGYVEIYRNSTNFDIISLCNADGSEIVAKVDDYDAKVKVFIKAFDEWDNSTLPSHHSNMYAAREALRPKPKKVKKYVMPEWKELSHAFSNIDGYNMIIYYNGLSYHTYESWNSLREKTSIIMDA